jgi:hypothetical protein
LTRKLSVSLLFCAPLSAHIPLGTDYFEMYAAFYLGFCLDSCFEILDLTTDDPHLQTVPQRRS